MVRDVVVIGLLAASLTGLGFGALHHSRFIKAGGQRGFSVVEPSAQTTEMRVCYRRMLLGYGAGLSWGAVLLPLPQGAEIRHVEWAGQMAEA